jgi:uncharacterized protein (DUF736 family)
MKQWQTIGSFTASNKGFSGVIKTLNLNVKATIRAVERASEKGPTTVSWPATSSSEQPGRRSRTKAGNTSR